MIRRPQRSTLSSSSAASDVYKRQVLEELEKTSEAAEAAWKESQRVLEQWQEIWRIDQKVCQALKPQMEERSEVMHQYEKINGLYQLLSGNRKNSRMDIETCLLYTSPSPRDGLLSRMPSSA